MILFFESKINLEKNINIPNPRTEATWFGPNPPEVAGLDPVLTKIDFNSGV